MPRVRRGLTAPLLLLLLGGCGTALQQCLDTGIDNGGIVSRHASEVLEGTPAEECRVVQDLGADTYRVECGDGREGYVVR